MKKYLPLTKENYFIKVEVDYELGGWSCLTGENNERGYYIYVRPVNKGDGFESFTLLDGLKQCVLPVNRRGKKAYEKACELSVKYENELIEKVLKEDNLMLKGE